MLDISTVVPCTDQKFSISRMYALHIPHRIFIQRKILGQFSSARFKTYVRNGVQGMRSDILHRVMTSDELNFTGEELEKQHIDNKENYNLLCQFRVAHLRLSSQLNKGGKDRCSRIPCPFHNVFVHVSILSTLTLTLTHT